MSGFELPPLDTPADHSPPATGSTPAPEVPSDDYEIAKARELDDAGQYLSNASGRGYGPYFASALDLDEGVTSFHISCRDSNGHTTELGSVPRDVTYEQLVGMDKILFAVDSGALDFSACPQHPRLGLLRKHTFHFRLDPARSLELTRALEAYHLQGDGFGEEDGEDDLVRPELHDHLVQYDQLMEGPIKRSYDLLELAQERAEKSMQWFGRMQDHVMSQVERSAASQMEAADLAMVAVRNGAELVQSSERHSAGIAIAAKRLELETPIGERILSRLLDADQDVDPMTMHRVMFGERMTVGDMVMDIVARKAADWDGFGGGGKKKKTDADVTEAEVVDAETVPAQQLASKRKCTPAEFVAAVRAVDKQDADAIRATFEQHGYAAEDLDELAASLPKRLVRAYRAALAVDAEPTPTPEPA